ncbi:MAG: response regulator [Flavobacteriales bacterium]|nr:response regulator [Flavobacteriales bacterium]
MKILIIDDTEALAETLKLNIELAIPGAEVSFQKLFDKALDDVATIAPDAIVLDIIRGSPGGAETDRPGDTLKHTLWDRHFGP